MYLSNRTVGRSQNLKITDTHVEFEHDESICCYCCVKVNHHIGLDQIWYVRYYAPERELNLLYNTHGNVNFQSCVSIRGLMENTPKLIKDTIIKRRHRL